MNDMSIFRPVNNIELNLISKSLDKISTNLLPFLNKLNRLLYISIKNLTKEKNYPSIHLVSSEQHEFLNEVKYKNIIYAGGLFFGLIKKGEFLLSIEGAEFLYISNFFTDFKKLILNENGEKSILYGNNILKKMLVHSPIDLKKTDFLLLLNENDEILGLGFSQTNNEQILNLKPSDLIALNLSDKGYYLRQQ